MSLKIRRDWLAAHVSMYATPVRKRRPSQAKPTQVVRTVATHGRYQIIEVLHRGKPSIRYIPRRAGDV